MAVDTLVPAGTLPEPAIDTLLNRMKKVLTNLLASRKNMYHTHSIIQCIEHEVATYNVSFWLVLFLFDDLLQFILIPLIHCIYVSI